MNPFSFFSWLWKAWRGQSVVFAGLFGAGLLGLSVMSWVKAALRALELNGLGVLLVPIALLGLLARWEKRWWPVEEWRNIWARRIVWGAGLLALVLSLVMPSKSVESVAPLQGEADLSVPSESEKTHESEEQSSPKRLRGPSGK